MNFPKMSTETVSQLQLLQRNLQTLSSQKQQIESQLTELNSALKELQNTEKAYKIVGKIMVVSETSELSKDISEKKEVAEIHLKNISSQEENLTKKMEELQQEAVKELKDE